MDQLRRADARAGETSLRLALEWLPGRYAMCRLDVGAPIPAWAGGAGAVDAPLVSVTRTDRELSIVAPESIVPPAVAAERGWVAMRVRGQLDFALVGILARLTGALAKAGVPVCAISTFDTDYLMVRERDRDRAQAALLSVARIG